jgi:hypothetical protein
LDSHQPQQCARCTRESHGNLERQRNDRLGRIWLRHLFRHWRQILRAVWSNTNAHGNTEFHANSNADANTYGDSDCHTYTQAFTYTKASSDIGASPVAKQLRYLPDTTNRRFEFQDAGSATVCTTLA